MSVNGIPLPGAGCHRKDVALLEAPGMFPIRLKIHRPRQGGVGRESMDAGGEYWDGGGEGGGLEGSLSRLKQVKK